MSRQVPFGRYAKNRALMCGNLVAAVIIFGMTSEAKGQADLNIQSRLAPYILPVIPSPLDNQPYSGVIGACLTDGLFIVLLIHTLDGTGHPLLTKPQELAGLQDSGKIDNKNPLVKYLQTHPILAAHILARFFSDPNNVAEAKKHLATRNRPRAKPGEVGILAIQPLQLPLCGPGKTTVKVTFPFNPDYETNVLKSNTNNSPGDSLGFGAALQMVTPGVRLGDVIGLSVQSQSVRYDQHYANKSFDLVTTQAAYQFFLDAYSYKANGTFVNISGEIGKPTSKLLPPQNMITIDTIAVGVQNQTTYSPTFHAETVDLFTPQVTLSRQNIPLSNLSCALAIPDPRKDGFCYYLDVAITVGQTFSDQTLQQNANVTASVTPGWRIPDSDWKLTLPIAVTARAYENENASGRQTDFSFGNVAGGRDDLLFQLGAILNYAPPPFLNPFVNTVLNFSASATYNRNYSTLSTAAWHGFIVLPTLTLAFQPTK